MSSLEQESHLPPARPWPSAPDDPNPQRPYARHSPGDSALVTTPEQLLTTLQPQKGTLLGSTPSFFCYTTIFGEQCQLWSNSVNISHTEFFNGDGNFKKVQCAGLSASQTSMNLQKWVWESH